MPVKNCIVCVLKNVIWYSSFLGIPPFYLECFHKRGVTKIKIKKSALRNFTCCFSFILLIAAFAYYAHLITNVIENHDNKALFFNLIYIFNVVRPFSEMICCCYKSKHFKNSVMVTNHFLQNWNLRLQAPLLDKRDYLQGVIASVFHVVNFLFFLCVLNVTFFFPGVPISIVKNIRINALIFIEIVFVTFYFYLLWTYIKILFNCQQFVMKKLSVRKESTVKMKSYIIKLLRNYRLIVSMMLSVNKFYSKFFSPTLLIVLLLGIVSEICCVSGITYGILYSKNHSLEDFWVECQLCISFATVTFAFAIFDKLTTMVSTKFYIFNI